jgi:hypothetical protein
MPPMGAHWGHRDSGPQRHWACGVKPIWLPCSGILMPIGNLKVALWPAQSSR